MSRVVQLFTILFLSMFVFVEIAQAELIRSGGRPTLSRVYESTVIYLDDQYNNAAGITPEAYDDLSNIGSRAFINGDNNPISAFPAASGCTRGYAQSDVNTLRDDTIPNLEADLNNYAMGSTTYNNILSDLEAARSELQAIELNDPCSWEFEYGETISTTGLFGLVFLKNGLLDSTIDYDVEWNINGTDEGGTINLMDASSASLTLNKDIDLAPGDYFITVSVGVSSDTGKFYYSSPSDPDCPVLIEGTLVYVANPNFIDEAAYINANRAAFVVANPTVTDPLDIEGLILDAYYADTNVSDPDVRGHQSIEQCGNNDIYSYNQTRTFSTSFRETLRILPANNGGPTISATAPGSLGVILMALGILAVRRRMPLRAKHND